MPGDISVVERPEMVSMLGVLRARMQMIVTYAADELHNGASSPAQDIWEVATEALRIETGREAQREFELLNELAYHVMELVHPLIPLSGVQEAEHQAGLAAAVLALARFRADRLAYWRREP